MFVVFLYISNIAGNCSCFSNYYIAYTFIDIERYLYNGDEIISIERSLKSTIKKLPGSKKGVFSLSASDTHTHTHIMLL